MPRHVKLDLNLGLGSSRVEIDGIDISRDVAAVMVSRTAGDADSIVHLQLRADVELTAEVERVLAFQPGSSPFEAVAELLDSTDPKALEAEALGRLGVTADSPAEAFLQVLKEWARDG